MPADLRGYSNAKIPDGKASALCFERMSIVWEKLAEIGTTKYDQEAKLHFLQSLSSRYALYKKLL